MSYAPVRVSLFILLKGRQSSTCAQAHPTPWKISREGFLGYVSHGWIRSVARPVAFEPYPTLASFDSRIIRQNIKREFPSKFPCATGYHD